jgi:glucose-6-phosphate dehydrogenase assembly protein OpcA
LQAGDHALAAGEDELDDVLAVVRVHALAELAPERDRLVRVDVCVARDDVPPGVDRRVRGDDRADAAARELQVPVDADLGAGAVVVVEPTCDARAEDAVLDLEIAEPQRLEDLAYAGIVERRVLAGIRRSNGLDARVAQRQLRSLRETSLVAKPMFVKARGLTSTPRDRIIEPSDIGGSMKSTARSLRQIASDTPVQST